MLFTKLHTRHERDFQFKLAGQNGIFHRKMRESYFLKWKHCSRREVKNSRTEQSESEAHFAKLGAPSSLELCKPVKIEKTLVRAWWNQGLNDCEWYSGFCSKKVNFPVQWLLWNWGETRWKTSWKSCTGSRRQHLHFKPPKNRREKGVHRPWERNARLRLNDRAFFGNRDSSMLLPANSFKNACFMNIYH